MPFAFLLSRPTPLPNFSWRLIARNSGIIAVSLAIPFLGVEMMCELPAQLPAPRGGGLLPESGAPISGSLTRDELIKRWDLNNDGRIDAAEAEMARSKMRRERRNAIQNSGVDPLTGKARTPANSGSVDPLTGRTRIDTNNPSNAPLTNKDPLIFPPDILAETPAGVAPKGSPRGQAPLTVAPPTQSPKGTQQPTAPGGENRTSVPIRPGFPALTPRPAVTTGGLRAGAAGARPGYGASGPKAPLNAGRVPGGLGLPSARGTALTTPPRQTPAMPSNRRSTADSPPSAFPFNFPRGSVEDIDLP